MWRILKALVLAWVGKKVYDAVTTEDEPTKVASGAGKTRGGRGRAKHA